MRMVYDTKKTAPFEKDEAMTLSGLLAVSEKLDPVKMPRMPAKRESDASQRARGPQRTSSARETLTCKEGSTGTEGDDCGTCGG